jgi:hypothetical protein
MKKLIIITALATIATGCKIDSLVDAGLQGMYVNGYSETLAIGQGHVTTIPGDREALAAHYKEDVAWLHPSIKIHQLDIFMVGTNSTANASEILGDICKAFADVAPTVAKEDADVAKSVKTTTPLDTVKAGGEVRKEIAKIKAEAAEKLESDAVGGDCPGGGCVDTDNDCPGGNCATK